MIESPHFFTKAVVEGVEPRWKPEDMQFPFPSPSEYSLKFGQKLVDLLINNPYTYEQQHVLISPARAYIQIASDGFTASFSELTYLYDRANLGLQNQQIALRYGLASRTVSSGFGSVMERNGYRNNVEPLIMAAERLGLLHPDLLPHIRNTFLTRVPNFANPNGNK